jgi:uncharacterized protein
MIGTLNHEQIEHVLRRELVGRIGFRSSEKLFIIPIAFTYADNCIYAHSRLGNKIRWMRQNSKVCFQVDSIDHLSSWRSVLLWGTYHEIRKPDEQLKAKKLIDDRTAMYSSSEATSTYDQSQAPRIVEKPVKTVIFRIEITEESGRFERSEITNA